MMNRINKLIVYIVFLIFFMFLFTNLEDNDKHTKTITPANGDLTIRFIDVGEADATLISLNGHNMLVDAGNNEDGKLLVNYFKSLEVNSFDYLVCTHSHEDHIGGMDNIIRSFNVDKFLIPDVDVEYMTYKEVIKEINEKNIEKITPKIDSSFYLDNVKISVFYLSNDKEDLNSSGIVLKLYYGNISILMMGDTPSEIEEKILDKDLESDVLKVGHHGSNDSTSAKFLYKVHPKYAIISVGKDNDYYHPHKVTLDKLNKINSKMYRTDLDGTIIMTTDGKEINFKTEKTNTNGD